MNAPATIHLRSGKQLQVVDDQMVVDFQHGNVLAVVQMPGSKLEFGALIQIDAIDYYRYSAKAAAEEIQRQMAEMPEAPAAIAEASE